MGKEGHPQAAAHHGVRNPTCGDISHLVLHAALAKWGARPASSAGNITADRCWRISRVNDDEKHFKPDAS